uniref:LOW QUALITY PROTEIN: protein SICKLE-like n=1 Tax=Elaeis guineensis var. tenera TaxID=51953 RepID=A0A6I9RV04_ELAGV|nr:LOW QUALITY PROTEIN: protein SICKLE-like [Elaeis guineensis]
MEDSAKRRQRLQAMRLEAEATSSSSSQSLNSSVPPSQPSPQLSNPLLDPPPASESSPPARRFDYYTDPMSAFSGAKRKGGPGAYCSPTPPPSRPNVGPRTFHMSHHQLHATQSQGSTSYQMPPQFSPNTSWRSPVQYSTPYRGYQGTPVGGSGVLTRSGGSFSDRCTSTPLSGGFSPHHGRGGSHVSTPGMRGSPHSNSGRGKGGRFSGYHSPRWTRGQGSGSYRTGSDRQEIDHYYHKSMVKDPWRKLKPIVGDITKPRNWLLDSKKVKVAESGSKFSFSKTGCLAQFLADEEAASEM